jgi:selenophosphate synthase
MKANTRGKDIAGLSAVDLCQEVGGDGLLRFFISACRESGVQITLSEEILTR